MSWSRSLRLTNSQTWCCTDQEYGHNKILNSHLYKLHTHIILYIIKVKNFVTYRPRTQYLGRKWQPRFPRLLALCKTLFHLALSWQSAFSLDPSSPAILIYYSISIVFWFFSFDPWKPSHTSAICHVDFLSFSLQYATVLFLSFVL